MKSIIFVGNKDCKRDEYYSKKDNWGMYKTVENPLLSKSELIKINNKVLKRGNLSLIEDQFYQEVYRIGRNVSHLKSIDNISVHLENKYKKININKKEISKLLTSYYNCYANIPDIKRKILIKKNLEKNLTIMKVDEHIQTRILNLENNKQKNKSTSLLKSTDNKKKVGRKNYHQRSFYQSLHIYLSEKKITTEQFSSSFMKECRMKKMDEKYLNNLIKAYRMREQRYKDEPLEEINQIYKLELMNSDLIQLESAAKRISESPLKLSF